MAKIAFIFPGQGAQYTGMGKASYEACEESRAVFAKANEILGFDLMKLCFEGLDEELKKTENSQPAILTASIAALERLKKEQPELKPDYCLGLSLGEYTALVAAGSISFEDAIKLVRLRGEAMEEAAQKNPGKMLSIIGMDKEEVIKLAKGCGCEVANLNCPGQVVVSGDESAIETVKGMARFKGAKRVIELDISGPFHSSAMDPASDKLRQILEQTEVKTPEIPVIANVTAELEANSEVIKKNLVEQVSHATRWEDSIRYLITEGVKSYYEIGPGMVLKGLLRRIEPKLKVENFE